MKKITFLVMSLFFTQLNAQLIAIDSIQTKDGTLTIQPITHASIILTYEGKTIYVDPSGDLKKYKNCSNPDIILITDIHPDHLNLKTLEGISTKKHTFYRSSSSC